jgi:aspartate racemase
LGIVGGAGVGASARLYEDVAVRVRRRSGQFPSIVIWSAPFGDALEAPFLAGDPDKDDIRAVVELVSEGVQRLVEAGATSVAMPCNTLQGVAETACMRVGVPFVDMIEATLEAVRVAGWTHAVLLATEATYALGAYERGDIVLAPPVGKDERTRVALAIEAAIAGGAPAEAKLRALVNRVRVPGGGVVLGCTDLCGRLGPEDGVIDSLACLAGACTAHLLGAPVT